MRVEFFTKKNFKETKKALFDAFPDCSSVIFDEKKQDKNTWISVNDETPLTSDEEVLVYIDAEDRIDCGAYNRHRGEWYIGDVIYSFEEITHWQNFPKKPKIFN